MHTKIFRYSLLVLLSFIVITRLTYSQISDLKQIPLQYINVKVSASIAIGDNELLFFYINPTQDSILSIRTTDLGNSWQAPSLIFKINAHPNEKIFLSALITDTKRIIVAWKYYTDSIAIINSDDLGQTWGTPQKITVGEIGSIFINAEDLVLTKSLSNSIYLSFSHSTHKSIWFIKSSDNGEAWTDSAKVIFSAPYQISSPSIITLDDINLLTVFSNDGSILKIKSSDAGETWSNPEIIFEDSLFIKNSRTILSEDNKFWLVYQKGFFYPYISPDWNNQQYYSTSDIYYRVSEDFGNTWQPEKRLTKYIGDDNYLSLTDYKNVPLISFATQRFTNNYSLTYLIPDKIEENKTPPYIIYSSGKVIDTLKNKYVFKTLVIDDESVQKVNINFNDFVLAGELFDDGLHQDNEAGDKVFANLFDLPRVDNYNSYLLDANNLKMPINNHGVIAAVRTSINLDGAIDCYDNLNNYIQKHESFLIYTSNAGGIFDSVVFLFSGGFFMSGLDGNTIWANAVASASLVEDYTAGIIGSDPVDKKNSIYVLKANDIPFGRSWQAWKDAVERGAEFYDGDNDGVYNPVDKNFNGIWDREEDMPMILGDETVWCVYNDGVPDSLRRWKTIPKGIEVAQTIFTSKESGLENVMFLRYKITNKSNVDYDSVYFGFWADTDLGDGTDDLVGCDTLLNSGFVYNDGTDWIYDYYGEAPPSFYTTLLQGPIVETNSSADTATLNLGEILGTNKIPNSKNLNITAQIIYIGGDPSLNDPETVIGARNYLMGKNKLGQYVDPCTWPYGHVFGGVDCNQVDKHFWFSGDPVNQLGWIDTTPSDHRNLLSTGPFNLKSNEPVDVITAYVVGRGTDALNSITITRQIVEGVIQEYENNFPRLTYKPGTSTNPIVSYELYQNYPNPFNPTTTIRYAIPQDGVVTLKIFDILGQEVATLKNEFQKANRYEVNFNSAGLASGVYIYRLQVNNFLESKKMILLK